MVQMNVWGFAQRINIRNMHFLRKIINMLSLYKDSYKFYLPWVTGDTQPMTRDMRPGGGERVC